MAEANQHTVAETVVLEGIGVHSGQPSRIEIKPGPPDTGIVFRRTDLPGRPQVPAVLENVTRTHLGTHLGADGAEVLTVEHVLAALAALQVDNATLDLEGPEPPIADGSFAPYVEAVRKAGRRRQEAKATLIELSSPVAVATGEDASYVAVPDEGYRISATIDFAHEAVGRQYGAFAVDADGFRAGLADARTFGFAADAEALHARGLALGASLENTVVLDDEGVLNSGLRFPDEFLRHKVGDLVGDLALMGGRFRGHVVAERPSHGGNVELARAIRRQHDASDRASRIGIRRIMEYLPHRYPMLLVDRIVEIEPRRRIVGIKNVTINEPFFGGHFPEHPVMPGVLVVEAMAQVGGLLLMDSVEDPQDKVVYFMSLDNVKWRRPITPGDQVVFELEMLNLRRRTCKMRGTGTVDGQVVAQAEMIARVVDK